MKKIINPCKCKTYNGRQVNAFACIEFKNERLSITGVVGPISNGNCYGSCGQCIDEIRQGTPTQDWTREMLNTFCDIWEQWHLNDMRPYCKHQKELGWDKKASEKVTLYNYKLSHEVARKQREIREMTLKALKNGTTFTPTDEQVKYANLEYSFQTYKEIDAKLTKLYEPRKPIYSGDKGATETKALGWLYENEHPEGLLCKPCPVCGYKYGTSWVRENVPEDVLKWLSRLPSTKIEPAWI